MNTEELRKLFEIMIVNSTPRYTSPSEAFLGLLKQQAKEHNLKAFAEIMAACKILYPENYRYISTRTPAKISNNYLTTLPGFDYERFRNWSTNNPNWAESIRKGCADESRLNAAVEYIKHAVAAFDWPEAK
ncbi:hypothetical protein [Inquilinus limosus]|uniref:hypothetical protein n=1 Tax=Inquilinus limosus TaxID=171674 RepID=UPI00126A0304|nr:hypothetical protein [Inquilinus limosus]